MTAVEERGVPDRALARAPADADGQEPPSQGMLLTAPWANDIDGFDMRHLRYFLAVVRTGTVSAAAQEQGISQPSMSQQIRRLERRVGTPLFVRSSRGVKLTAGGQKFLRGVQSIPGQLRSAIASAAPSPAVWTVGVCRDVPAELLSEVEHGLTSYRAAGTGEEDGPQLRMTSVDAASQWELLQHAELSFGIVRLPLDEPRLVHATVRDEALGIVLGAGHPLAAQPALGWSDLADQRLLWDEDGFAPGDADMTLARLAELGWQPPIEPMDFAQHSLFVHALWSTPDLVALRPQRSVYGHPQLSWRPLPTAQAPREQLAVTALAGSPEEQVLHQVAAARHWPVHG